MKKRNKYKILCIFIVLIILFLSIGYSAFGTELLIGKLVAEVRIKSDIRVTGIGYEDNSSMNEAISNYEEYNVKSVSIGLNLPKEDSAFTYKIEITNFGSTEMALSDITGLNDNLEYEILNYDLHDTICNDNNECNLGITKDVLIKIKYKNNKFNPQNTTYSINLFFHFLHPVKYIESTGTQFIDTEIIPNNNTNFDLKFSLNNVDSTHAIFGTRISTDEPPYFNLFFHYKSNNSDIWLLRWDEYTSKTKMEMNYNEGSIINITKKNNNVIVSTNGSTYTINSSSDNYSLSSSIHIFGINQQSSPETRYSKMKLYYLKLYQGNELVRDYIPVLDENGVACLYDLISKKYFYNDGSGEFNYGDEYTTVKYIESTGTQYIDTKTVGSNKTKVELVMSLNELNDQTQGIFGGRIGVRTSAFNIFYYKAKIRWDYNDVQDYPTLDDELNKATYISANKNSVSINDTLTTYNYTGTFNTNYNIYIFSVNTSQEPLYLNSGMKLYYFKIFENDKVVRNFIPVLDKNGVACLYDQISKTYFYNKGSGNFVAG